MKYVKTFEDHTERVNTPESIIKEIWGVDPYIFYDIISSSMEEFDIWGELKLQFSLLYPTPSTEAEFRPIYSIENGEVKPGIYLDNLNGILYTNSYTPIIEAWIESTDVDKNESLMETTNIRLDDANIPYLMDYPEGLEKTTYLFFNKKENKKAPKYLRYIKTNEGYNNSTLIIVDVQKSFRRFFSEMYLHELKKYCKTFSKVYQIFDNHVDGKDTDKDYLYDKNPDIPTHSDLYHFPNQVDIIEKRYQYDVDVDFYKKILNKDVYKEIKKKEDSKELKRGDFFNTTEGTIIVYIGNNHVWHHLSKKLYNLFIKLKGQEVIMIGGSDSECYLDIETSAKALGVKIKRDFKYIYSANNCPIK